MITEKKQNYLTKRKCFSEGLVSEKILYRLAAIVNSRGPAHKYFLSK